MSTEDIDLTVPLSDDSFGAKKRGIHTPATQQYLRRDSIPQYLSIVGIPMMSGSSGPENSINQQAMVTLRASPPNTCAPVNVSSHWLT